MRIGLRLSIIVAVLMAGTACTRMPTQFMATQKSPVMQVAHNNQLMQLIANARIGLPQTHVDSVTGLTSTITVTSEYFSANGRSCRRYSQHKSNASQALEKLSCLDKRNGWYEISIASIVE